jgi:hypothetical protein
MPAINHNPRTKYERAQCELIDNLSIEVVKLRHALRSLAVHQHVRMAAGGGTVPSGGSCVLCKTEWPAGWPENHTAACLLANKSS